MIIRLLARLGLALVLGGLIGFERERGNRPAGLRTHILVCVSAALVMLTGEFMYERFYPEAVLDPLRLGAQVVSGIGFLGAGAIIREGATVRGLTTAAGLWAVACIGIAAGAGYYLGAAVATAVVYGSLVILHAFERKFAYKSANFGVFVEMRDEEAQRRIEETLAGYRVEIRRSSLMLCDGEALAKYLLHLPDVVSRRKALSVIAQTEGVTRVYEDGQKRE